jgi:uncharacterized protein YjiS (DUF1127 family)
MADQILCGPLRSTNASQRRWVLLHRRLFHVPACLAITISRWIARSAQRRALSELATRDDSRHFLSDIGISQDEALREASKPFWRR